MSFQTLIKIHDATHVLSMPLSVLIALWYSPKYGYSRKKGATYSLTMMVIIVLFTYACRWIPGWFGIIATLNSYRSFLIAPLCAWVMSRYWNIPMLHGLDFITPNIMFVRTFVLIGCTLLGCGLAMPMEWGIYSPTHGGIVFPMDLIDLVANFAVSIFSLIYAKKLNYNGSGRIFALSMYLLAAVRLFIQFGSLEVWWIRGFNDESVYSIVTFIMAIVIYRNWQKNNLNKSKERNGGK